MDVYCFVVSVKYKRGWDQRLAEAEANSGERPLGPPKGGSVLMFNDGIAFELWEGNSGGK